MVDKKKIARTLKDMHRLSETIAMLEGAKLAKQRAVLQKLHNDLAQFDGQNTPHYADVSSERQAHLWHEYRLIQRHNTLMHIKECKTLLDQHQTQTARAISKERVLARLSKGANSTS